MKILSKLFVAAASLLFFAGCETAGDEAGVAKVDATLAPSTSIIGMSYAANTLTVTNAGVIPSAAIAIKGVDGSSMRGVEFDVDFANDTDTSEEWYTITPSTNSITVMVLPYAGKDISRSVDVTLSGSGAGITLNELTFKLEQTPTAKSAAAHIESFEIEGQSKPADIDYQNLTITAYVPFGTDVTALAPAITNSALSTITPANGEAQDFTEPVVYVVTAEDGTTTSEYTATVVVEAEKSHAANITSFSISGQVGVSSIIDDQINIIMAPGAVVSSLAPIVSISDKATVSPASGQNVDFTNPVTYTVTAEDGVVTKEYTVTVIIGGEVNLIPDGDLSDDISLSGTQYQVVSGGASTATQIKAKVYYSDKEILDLSNYTFVASAVDIATGDNAAWVHVAEVANAKGVYTFTVDANTADNIRRAWIKVETTDKSGAKQYGVSYVIVEQDGVKVKGNFVQLVDVKGGRFLEGYGALYSRKNYRYCNLTSFSIGVYEITQSQYEEIMGYNPSKFIKDGETCPVECVTMWDAMMFCDKLSEREGYTPFYNLTDIVYGRKEGSREKQIMTGKRNCDMNATGYRLPTRAEREYAMKGGVEQIEKYLYMYAGSDELKEVAWYRDNNGERPKPVGGKLPNTLGLYDMSGNVNEWCHDWYDGNIFGYPTADEVTDPFGPDEPFNADEHCYSAGGYYYSYHGDCSTTYCGLQASDNGFYNADHLGVSSAHGIRVVIRR